MKKRIIALMVATLMCCTMLIGCGSNKETAEPDTAAEETSTKAGADFSKDETTTKLETAANEIMIAITNFDNDTLNKYWQSSSEDSNDSDDTKDETPILTETITDIAKQHAQGLAFEIKEIDSKNLTVTVTCTYDDLSSIMSVFKNKIIAKANSGSYTKEDLTSDAGMSATFQEAHNDIYAAADYGTITEDITLTFTKDGDNYVLADDPNTTEVLKRIMMANMEAGIEE